MTKTITLVKPYSEIELVHLYEHLYLNALRSFFRKHNLLSYLDYHLEATTYQRGFTHIEIVLYTPEAAALIDQLSSLEPDFSYNSVNGCLGEIVAEEKVALIGEGTISKELVNSLYELHQQPWINLDDLGSLDTLKSRRSFKALWVSSDKVRTKTLQCELILGSSYSLANRHLWPLFWLVSDAVNNNLFNALVKLGVSHYHFDSKVTCSPKVVKRSDMYRTWIVTARKLTDELEACKVEITEILELGLIARLEQYMQAISYSERGSPKELELFEVTGILIGAAGWREIGTKENIEVLLRHTTLQLVYGREKQATKLAELI